MSAKIYFGTILCLFSGICLLAQERPVTVADCVTVRYPVVDRPGDGIVLSKDGNEVAYLIKTPVLATNDNQIQLFIKSIYESTQPVLISTGQEISALRWVDQNHIDALMKVKGRIVVVSFDVSHHSYDVAAHADKDITDYSVDATGRTIVYAVPLATPGAVARRHSAFENRTGYYVDIDRADSQTGVGDLSQRILYIEHKEEARNEWAAPRRLKIRDPFSGVALDSLFQEWNTYLSLSPNGKWLLFRLGTSHLPASWNSNPLVHRFAANGLVPMVTVLYSIATGQERIPIPAIYSQGVAIWSRDSRSYLVKSPAPVGSVWEREDEEAKRKSMGQPDLFRVDVQSGSVEEVLADAEVAPNALWWTCDGTIVLRISFNEIAGFQKIGKEWRKEWTKTIPLERIEYPIVTDGRSFVGFYDNITSPPKLFIYKPEGSITSVELNPQFDHVRLATVKTINWKTSDGRSIGGYLFMPLDYTPSHRYPLVIQTKPSQGWFSCDSGWNHSPEFLPQPMASAGMIYLTRTWPSVTEREDYPGGYPGQVGEAVWDMDVWESAIKELVNQGLVDPAKVGIIGFSRTGWEVEYFLAHSSFHFAAATASDNVQYSLGEYWLSHGEDAALRMDQMYGGSPNGIGFQNWVKYSISFNLAKVRTPLLMSTMGYGVHDDVDGAVPIGLAMAYEVATGLSRLNRPVQLYYYPDEVHEPDHPVARLANLQRSLDWYRFWLQGYEEPSPVDPTQYARWSNLQNLSERLPKSP